VTGNLVFAALAVALAVVGLTRANFALETIINERENKPKKGKLISAWATS
jgi:hypothetical protein